MKRPDVLYILLSLIICGPVLVAIFAAPLVFHLSGSDVWEHLAALRQLQADPWAPSNPHLDSFDSSPRFMPLFVVFAVFGNALGWDGFATIQAVAVITVILLPIGAYLFLRRYFNSPWAPVYGLLILVFFWGWAPNWTSMYNFRSLFYNVFYPSTFVFAGTFFLLWWTLEALRRPDLPAWRGPILAFGAGLLLLCHPLSGLFAIASVALLAAVDPGIALIRRVLCLAWIAAGVVAAELWPYFSIHHATLGSAEFRDPLWQWDAQLRFYDPLGVAMMLGPALLGLPVLLYFLRRNRMHFLVIGAAGNIGLYLLWFVTDFPLGHRFLPFALFFLHLAVIWAALRLHEAVAAGTARRLGVVAVALAGLVMIAQFAFPARDIALYAYWKMGEEPPLPPFREDNWQYRAVRDEMTALASALGDDAIVLSNDADINHVLPAFGGKVVRQQRGNPFASDAAERNAAVDVFFSRCASNERRREIIRHYRVTHVVTGPDDSVLAALGDMAAPGWRLGHWTIAEIRPSTGSDPDPPEQMPLGIRAAVGCQT